ncbi:MAG: cobaltochelatase subunit CobN, partial [Muribaculaceae bacterium]|nr:cobaltochelatase subunit CobN [Muribaculaceae bacterium]
MKQRKKTIIIAACCVALVAAGVAAWRAYASATRIAFVNYQAITLGQIAKACDNSFVRLAELPVDELERAADFDLVLVNGMGLRITEEQRAALAGAAEAGTPVLTTAATNPQNYIVSVDSVDAEFIRQYLAGGKANYRNLLRYVRKFVDGKKLFADEPSDPVVPASSLLYYPGADNGDDKGFASVAEYEAWLGSRGKWRADAKRVLITGQMGVPDSLVAALERRGHMVYCVSSIQPFIMAGHADSVAPAAMI